jgi:hypothetical protein
MGRSRHQSFSHAAWAAMVPIPMAQAPSKGLCLWIYSAHAAFRLSLHAVRKAWIPTDL